MRILGRGGWPQREKSLQMYPRGAPEMKLTSEHCAERLLLLANTRARTNFDGRDGATRQKVSDTIYSCKFGVTFRSL